MRNTFRLIPIISALLFCMFLLWRLFVHGLPFTLSSAVLIIYLFLGIPLGIAFELIFVLELLDGDEWVKAMLAGTFLPIVGFYPVILALLLGGKNGSP